MLCCQGGFSVIEEREREGGKEEGGGGCREGGEKGSQ